MDDRAGSVDIRLFGPVEVLFDGRPLDLGPAKPRLVLAALTLSPGELVPIDVLADRVWGQDLPDQPAATLYPYLSRLRRVLAPAGIDIARRTGGYVCGVAPQAVDVGRFRELVRTAKASTGQVAISALTRALAGRRDEALTGLSGEWVSRVRVALDQERLAGWLLLAEHRHADGSLATIAHQLRDVSADHPLCEPLAGYVLRALVAAGRRAEALELYARTRARLVEELGEEPGEELAGLHTALLRREPGALTRPATPDGSGRPGVPRQLPPVVWPFVGRTACLAQLDDLISAAAASRSLGIAVITGPGGIGKTTLATHWAHRVADRFPDGQLAVDLRGFDPPAMTPADALRDFLAALGVAAADVPPDLTARSALFRSLVAEKRLLILLDNAGDSEQIRPLLPGGAGCLVLVTSRTALTGLVAEHGSRPIGLGPLDAGEARDVLAARIGRERLDAEPAASDDLLLACSGLPLALAVIAGQLAQHPERSLTRFAARFTEHRSRLDAFDTEDPRTTLRAVFSASYDALDPETQRTFRLLGVHPGPHISTTAATSLVGRPDTVATLRRLLAANLITLRHDRYGMHDLLRSFARELAEGDPEAGAATGRMLDHYTWSSYFSEKHLVPLRTRQVQLPPAAAAAVHADQPADADEAMAWYDSERELLLNLIQLAGPTHDVRIIPLADTFGTYLSACLLYEDWVTVEQVALTVAGRHGDQAAASMAHRGLARAWAGLGRHAEAADQLDAALRVDRATGDRMGEAFTLQVMASVEEKRNDLALARDHARRACELYRQLGNRAAEGRALNQYGWFSAHAGQLDEAVSACEAAIAAGAETADLRGQAQAWDSLGYAWMRLGQQHRAIPAYRTAVTMWTEVGSQYPLAESLTGLGDALHETAATPAAREAWQQALNILAGLPGHRSEQARTGLVSRLTDGPTR